MSAAQNHFCYRHRPDLRTPLDTQKRRELEERLAKLSQRDRDVVIQIWNAFGAAPRPLRPLILDGMLDQCCLPQLSYMSSALVPLLRIDFIKNAPTEIAIRILQYLDGRSLCHAAQVSKAWKKVADDDIIWHRMCEQHIDKKCTKCGWGLPLLPNKRKAITAGLEPDQKRQKTMAMPENQNCAGLPVIDPQDSALATHQSGSECQAPQSTPSPTDTTQRRAYKRPWKEIYAERLIVERNWRKGNYVLRELRGHTDSVMCLHYDECRSLLVTGSTDYDIRVWNTDTMQCIKVLKGHTRCVRGIQMDDMKIVSASMDRTLRIWNAKTFECIRVLEGHAAGVVCLHFLDKMLASGSSDGSIRVWNLGAGCCFTLTGHREWVNKVQVLDKTRLLSCSDDFTVKLWNLETRQEVRAFTGHVGHIHGLQAILPHSPPRVEGITLSCGMLVTGSLDSTIKIWCLATGRNVKTLFGHVEGVWCVAVDSLRIVSGGQDRKVIVWDVESGKPMYELAGHGGAVNCCQMTDTKIITGAQDGVIRIWDYLPTPLTLFPTRQH